MAKAHIKSVTTYAETLRDLLAKARDAKAKASIEPALTASDFGAAIENIRKRPGIDFLAPNASHFAAIETVCREYFSSLVATTPIDDPAFNEVWNLLDIISILSDTGQCEPGLLFWLVEELLDSQTIDGCGIIFDYLDSRRERITAKHFGQKQLIILRACNELLRRLSRAETTVFCGRVFIFLFQSFPLGDRSSVNLRGEYHVENVTTYEDQAVERALAQDDPMQMDTKFENADTAVKDETPTASVTENIGKNGSYDADTSSKMVAVDGDTDAKATQTDMDELYPVFWSLQETYSNPTSLFEEANFQRFKSGLHSTMHKLQSVHQELQGRGTSKVVEESKRGTKRRRGDDGSELSTNFNPKYLTSRDLFELEISDLAFRRHILVQALILTDFLLSLTPKAKKKLEDKTNKSVMYSYTLSESDIQWAIQMKSDIAAYLQQGPEGKFYYRMIDTVLTRDKNWTHWKAEGCLPIERASVPAEDFSEAQKGAQRAYTNKRLRSTPMGSLYLNFLSDTGSEDGFRQLAKPERYTIPSIDSFKGPIADDDFDIDMAQTDELKKQAADARASKLWRTLRVASKSRLNMLDKIDDGQDLQALFEPSKDENPMSTESKEEGVPEDENQDVTNSTSMQSNEMNKVVALNLEINGIVPREKDKKSQESAQNVVLSESTSEIPQGSIAE